MILIKQWPLIAALSCLLCAASHAKKNPWLLGTFMNLSEKEPDRVIRIATQLFSLERVKAASHDASRAFEWQHRLAMISALSTFYDPAQKMSLERRKAASQLIIQAMRSDPSLVVRDGAVESIRRIIRMKPDEALKWQGPLENAFLDKKNILDNEGFFIRETILTALREGSLRPTKKVIHSAQHDYNERVRVLLRAFNGNSYDQKF